MTAIPPPKVDSDAQKAARQLEAFFVRRLLAEARPQGGSALDGGFAGDTFKQMLDEAIADKMVGAGGIGMASMFAKQLGDTEAPASPHAHAFVPHAASLAGLPPQGDARLAMPVIGRFSSNYGARVDPIHGQTTNHPGVDVAAPLGTPVSAAAGGTVVHAGPAGTYGNLVTIRHADGLETRYAHLSAVTVAKGDVLQAGADIGRVGSTGRSTGPHLHFEVREGGKPVDPAGYLPLNTSPSRPSR